MIVKVGQSEVDVRVEAVLSMPRLAFTSNTFAWAQALTPLGIRPTMGTGAFWDQVNFLSDQTVIRAIARVAINHHTIGSDTVAGPVIALVGA